MKGWKKIIEMMKLIKTGDNILFDIEDGVFKITKLDSPNYAIQKHGE